MFGKKSWGRIFLSHHHGSAICRASCVRADAYVATCQHARHRVWLCEAGPVCGELLPRNAVGRWEQLFTAALGDWCPRGIVHPFHQQAAGHVCTMCGCERDGVCAEQECMDLGVYVSVARSSNVCTAGRRAKLFCEASSIPVSCRRETHR